MAVTMHLSSLNEDSPVQNRLTDVRFFLLLIYVLLWPPPLVLLARKSYRPDVFGRWSYQAFGLSATMLLLLLAATALVACAPHDPRLLRWTKCGIVRVRQYRFLALLVALFPAVAWLVAVGYIAAIDVPLTGAVLISLLDTGLLVLVITSGLALIGRVGADRRRWLMRLLAVGAGLLIAVSVAEGLGAAFQFRPYTHWNINPKQLDVRFRTDDFDTTVKTNVQGLREPVEVQQQHPGHYRIVVVGDSMTFGWGVEADQTYPRVAQRVLREDYGLEQLEIVNMGRPGASPADYLKLIRHYAFVLKPDLIVVGFLVGNDCPVDAPARLRNDEQVQSRLTALRTVTQIHPVEQLLFHSHFMRMLHAGFVLPLRGWGDVDGVGERGPVFREPNPLDRNTIERAIGHHQDDHKIWSRYDRLVEQGWVQKGLTWAINPWLVQAVILRPGGAADSLAVREETRNQMWYEWRLCEGLLLEMRSAADQAGVDFLVFAIPNAHLVSQKWVEFLADLGCDVSDRMTTSRVVNDWLQQFCLQHDIGCLDPLDDFRNHPDADNGLYLRTDDHMTPAGQRLLGEKLAQWLHLTRLEKIRP